MTAKIKAAVGDHRITVEDSASMAAATRQTRAQLKAITDSLNAIMKGIEDATPGALYFALRPIYDLSQTLVPVDKGALKTSGYLESRNSRGRPQAELGYARGGSPSYAVYVHENLEAKHKSPTQAKFLQAPLEMLVDTIPERIKRYINGEVGIQ